MVDRLGSIGRYFGLALGVIFLGQHEQVLSGGLKVRGTRHERSCSQSCACRQGVDITHSYFKEKA